MTGTALGVAMIGVEDLGHSLDFYHGHIGLDIIEQAVWRGQDFEAHWGLPTGSEAKSALLGFGDSKVGRVLLLEFDASDRHVVRENKERTFYGLFNLNFYCNDIVAATAEVKALGMEVWSDPVTYDMSEAAGQPTEVLYEAPDGVIVNLVQPAGSEDTSVGEMRTYLDKHGVTSTGFTEIATSSHRVRDRDRGFAFHENVLGQRIFIDAELASAKTNTLLGLPEDAATRVTFMRGEHPFGKMVLSQPLNYDPPDLVRRAVAPHIGYLAAAFPVPDLSAALQAAALDEGEVVVTPMELAIPGVGTRSVALIRSPASGALYQMYEDEIPLP